MIVSSSRSAVIKWSSSAIDASPGDVPTATMPSPRTMPIQSPAAIGPASLFESRMACVTSPVATLSIARSIAAKLSELDPAGRPDYQKNLAAFESKLAQKDKEWAAIGRASCRERVWIPV